ncbi:MAG: type II toxin-antitoxin system HigB family toxin [Hydrogenophaga sp.]|nr:type II toxin-antitoxin system HigB family toxin [Hydrogenophaga sp.]
MKIVSVKILKDFWLQHPDSEQHLKAWIDEAKHAVWLQPADIKDKYRSASVLKNRRIVFNIKGNHYRLIVAIAYKFSAIYVKFIGTHQQYDLINAETIELE